MGQGEASVAQLSRQSTRSINSLDYRSAASLRSETTADFGGTGTMLTMTPTESMTPPALNTNGLSPTPDSLLASTKLQRCFTQIHGHPPGVITAEQASKSFLEVGTHEAYVPESSAMRRRAGDEDLWLAAQAGNVEQVQALLEDNANISWKVESCDEHAMEYKGRKVTAQCIHVAVLHGHVGVVRELLKRGAKADAEFCSLELKRKRSAYPIHIAAGSGHVEVLQLLLEHRAKPDSPAMITDKDGQSPHYYPIHDAVWFNKVDSVRALMEAKACYELGNFQGVTCLHMAAQLGHVECIEFLLGEEDRKSEFPKKSAKLSKKELQRLLRLKDSSGKQAIEVAITKGCLPAVKLHYFLDSLDAADKTKAFKKVAKSNPASVPYLLRPSCDSPEVAVGSELLENIGNDWKECFTKNATKNGFTVHDLAELIYEAPQAFMDLLEILTVEPQVENAGHNSLPIRTHLPNSSEHCTMRVEYRPESIWEWDRQRARKQWHCSFAPEDPKRGKEVKVKVVTMKGLADLEIVFCLAVASDLHVFTKLSVHALLRHMWNRLYCIYLLDLLHEIAATTIISLWAREKEWMLSLDRKTHHALWCIPASFAIMEVGMLTWGAINLLCTLRSRHGLSGFEKQWDSKRVWKKSKKIWFLFMQFVQLYPHRACMAGLTMSLVIVAGGEFESTPGTDILLSTCALLHWVFLLVRFQAFPWLGRKLLPIIRSFIPISGMFFILVFLILGFLHAYWALELDEVGGSGFLYEVTAFLFTGEPFSALTALNEINPTKRNYTVVLSIFALFLFPCCALNVFIAVLSDTYDSEQEKICCTFLQERAKVCLILLLRPKIRFGFLPDSVEKKRHKAAFLCAGAVIVSVSSLVVSGLIHASSIIGSSTVWMPAFVMAGCMLLLQGITCGALTYKWEQLHLWYCVEATLDEINFLTAADRTNTNNQDGRLTRLRTELERLRSDFKIRLDRNFKDIKAIRIAMDGRCPNGHQLEDFRTERPRACAMCGSTCPHYSLMFGCRRCKYAKCRRCKECKDTLQNNPFVPPMLSLEKAETQQTNVTTVSMTSGHTGQGFSNDQRCYSKGTEGPPTPTNGYESEMHDGHLEMQAPGVLPLYRCHSPCSNDLEQPRYAIDDSFTSEGRSALDEAVKIRDKVDKVQASLKCIDHRLKSQEHSLETVTDSLKSQEEKIAQILQMCEATHQRLEEVVVSARSRKKDKERKGPRLDPLLSPLASRPSIISSVSFGDKKIFTGRNDEEDQSPPLRGSSHEEDVAEDETPIFSQEPVSHHRLDIPPLPLGQATLGDNNSTSSCDVLETSHFGVSQGCSRQISGEATSEFTLASTRRWKPDGPLEMPPPLPPPDGPPPDGPPPAE